MHRESNTCAERREKNTFRQKRPPMPMGLVGRNLGHKEAVAFGSALPQYMQKDKNDKRRQTLPEVSFAEVPYDEQFVPAGAVSQSQATISYNGMLTSNIAPFSPVEAPWVLNNGVNSVSTDSVNLGQWPPTWTQLDSGCIFPTQPSQFTYPHGILRMPMFTTAQPITSSQCVYTNNEYSYVPSTYNTEYGMQLNQQQPILSDMAVVDQAQVQTVGTIGDDKKTVIPETFGSQDSSNVQELQCQLRSLQLHCEMIQQTMDQERRKLNGIRSACEGLVREMQAAGLDENATVLMDALDSSIDQPLMNNCNINSNNQAQTEGENQSEEETISSEE